MIMQRRSKILRHIQPRSMDAYWMYVLKLAWKYVFVYLANIPSHVCTSWFGLDWINGDGANDVVLFKLFTTTAAEGGLLPLPSFFLLFDKKAVKGEVMLFFPKLICFFSFSVSFYPGLSLFLRSSTALLLVRSVTCRVCFLCSFQRPIVNSQSILLAIL